MKSLAFLLALICLFLCLCAFLFGCDPMVDPTVQPIYRMNSVVEFDGNSVCVTDATVSKTYLASDGTEYIAEASSVLIIVKCRASFTEAYSIHKETTTVGNAAIDCNLLCEPFWEVSDTGEESLILLFNHPVIDKSVTLNEYMLHLNLKVGPYLKYLDFSLEQRSAD